MTEQIALTEECWKCRHGSFGHGVKCPECAGHRRIPTELGDQVLRFVRNYANFEAEVESAKRDWEKSE